MIGFQRQMLDGRLLAGAELVVRSGLHAGSAIGLDGAILVGRHPDADIRLLDDSVAERHARLTLARGMLTRCQVSVEPVDAPVAHGGASRHDPFSVLLGGDAETVLELGDVSLGIRTAARRFPGHAVYGGAAILLGAVSAFYFVVIEASARQPAPTGRFAPMTDPGVGGRESRMSVVAVRNAVERRIAEAGLADELSVEISAADGVATAAEISGEIDPDKKPAVRDVLVWYDSVPGLPVLFNAVSERAEGDRPMPEIASIELSPETAIVTTGGRRIERGGQLPSGWTFDRVAGSKVHLSLGQSRLVVDLQAANSSR